MGTDAKPGDELLRVLHELERAWAQQLPEGLPEALAQRLKCLRDEIQSLLQELIARQEGGGSQE